MNNLMERWLSQSVGKHIRFAMKDLTEFDDILTNLTADTATLEAGTSLSRVEIGCIYVYSEGS